MFLINNAFLYNMLTAVNANTAYIGLNKLARSSNGASSWNPMEAQGDNAEYPNIHPGKSLTSYNLQIRNTKTIKWKELKQSKEHIGLHALDALGRGAPWTEQGGALLWIKNGRERGNETSERYFFWTMTQF